MVSSSCAYGGRTGRRIVIPRQRQFNIDYSRAGRLVDQFADHAVIGAYQGAKSREVFMNLLDVDDLLERLGLK